MKYTYLSLLSLTEGYSIPPQEIIDFEYYVVKNTNIEAIITNLIDTHCFDIDRRKAFGELLLGGGFGDELDVFNNKTYGIINRITTERKAIIGNHLSLIIKFTDNIDIQIPKSTVERNNVVVCFDASDNDKIKSNHESILSAIISSICIESGAICRSLSDGIYFHTEDGKTLYSYSAQFGNPRVSISNSLNSEKQKSISEFTDFALKLSNDLTTVYRLYVLMLQQNEDRLRVFLFGWTAFEILIKNTYKLYKAKFDNHINLADPIVKKDLQRIYDTIQDKKSITGKFTIIISQLSRQTFDDDIKIFNEIRDARNSFIHEQSVSDNELPNENLGKLLTKYLKLHVAR